MEKTILIVEDEFIVADDLQMTLQKAGYIVVGIADNVETARIMIKEKKPSLAMLDIHLKGKLTGIELATELKEIGIAFIFLSANSSQKVLEEAKTTDPYGFLVKPFREKDLLVMLDIAFYKHENSNEVKWRTESLLQKELYLLEQRTGTIQERLLDLTKGLQKRIPFDLISFKFQTTGGNEYCGISLLRSGFNEYQIIGSLELGVIAKLSQHEISTIIVNSPVDRRPKILNGPEFTEAVHKSAMWELLAKSFSLRSQFIFPVAIEDGRTATIAFFRKADQGFLPELQEELLRLQYPIASVISSIAGSRCEPNLSGIGDAVIKHKNRFDKIVGSSDALYEALNLVSLVAPVDTSVLILGESGTGKEKIAEAIHQLSPRKNKPFIKINCAALPPSLIESELFGHEKGAFTNALEKRIGKFEMAHTGTIFLDEIGEVTVEMQVKLLRVLQEREIERVGGKSPVKVDVRIIAATNRNLQEEMAVGKFRLDLYYRLNVFPITLAPLRDRKEDICELAEYFAQAFCKRFNKPYLGVSISMQQQLNSYDFPGNIRELENIVEHAVILSDGKLPLNLKNPLSPQTQKNQSISEIRSLDDLKILQRQTETAYLSSILKKTRGRIRGKDGAAELLNEKPTTLESRLLRLGINRDQFQ